jgi:prepilin-type N-terminal cleavage/methylation domain-containing protein
MTRFRKSMNRKGLTMMELMVVVVVVGILAAIAIPLYGSYIRNARVTEATSRIGELITAAKAVAQENQDAGGNPTWPAANMGVFNVATPTDHFTYAVTGGGGSNANTTAFSVTATGVAGDRMAGVTIVVTVPNINSNGNAPVVTGI